MPNTNSNEDTTKDLDALRAEDLNRLSFTERSAIDEEIHGVDWTEKETPELVEEKLVALQDELDKIRHKPAYDEAIRISNSYIGSPKFRLMFLRADYLDPKKAAIRLVQFMEKKLQYFGPEPLARQICLSDFDKNDLKALKSGVFQSLPERDTAGRLILGSFQKQFHSRPYKRPENLVRSWNCLGLLLISSLLYYVCLMECFDCDI